MLQCTQRVYVRKQQNLPNEPENICEIEMQTDLNLCSWMLDSKSRWFCFANVIKHNVHFLFIWQAWENIGYWENIGWCVTTQSLSNAKGKRAKNVFYVHAE